MSSSLDQTGQFDNTPDPSAEAEAGTVPDSAAETQNSAEAEPAKKKMNGFLKVILVVAIVFFLAVMGMGGYFLYLKNKGSSQATWQNVEDPNAPALGAPDTTVTSGTSVAEHTGPEGSAERAGAATPPIFKTPGGVQLPKVEVPTLNQPLTPVAQTQPVFDTESPMATTQSEEPLTAMERLAAEAQESNTGTEEDYGQEHGHLSLGDDDLHESVLAEVLTLKALQEEHEQRFKSFDLAATALHRAHKEQLDALAHNQQRTDSALLSIKSELIAFKSELKNGMNQEAVEKAVKQVEAATKVVEQLAAQSKKNDTNILWLSRERMCFLEAQMGITKYSRQCADFNKANKVEKPLAIQSIQKPAAVAPVYSTSPDVPATVGVVTNPAPVANTTMVANNRPSNPCTYSDRTWKLQLIGANSALLVRATDGFETVVEPHTSIPGLGRAQLFNAQGYPQYVQFTNGIVCGG